MTKIFAANEVNEIPMNKEGREANLKGWRQFKENRPEYVMLFRGEDIYFTFEEDADAVRGVCECRYLVWDGVRLAFFAVPSLDTNLPKLIRAGRKVGIVDPLEAPKAKRRVPIQQELFTM